MAAPNQRTDQGTGFTNYGDILNANQGSGQALGQAVGQGLQSQANSVNSNLGTAQNQFNTGINNSNTDYSNVSQLANTLASNSTKDLASGDWSNISAQDPTQAANNAQTLNAYTYQGPTSLNNAQGLQSQAQAASQVGQLANTSTGQQQLLKSYVGGNNNYNQGDASFDQALLNKYGQGDINKAKQSLGSVNTNVTNALNNAGNEANATQNAQYGNRTNLENTISNNFNGGGTNPGSTSLLGNAQNNENQYVTNGQALQNVFNSSNYLNGGASALTPAQLASIQGLIPNASQYGIDTGQAYDMGTASNNVLSQGSGNSQAAQNAAIAALFNSTNSAASAAGGAYRFNDPNQLSAANVLNSFTGNGATPITNNTNQYFNPDANTSQVNAINANDAAAISSAQNNYNQIQDINKQAKDVTTGLYPTLNANNIGKDINNMGLAGQQLLGSTNANNLLNQYGVTNSGIDIYGKNYGGGSGLDTGAPVNTNSGVEQSTAQQYTNAYQNYLNNLAQQTGTKTSVGDYLSKLLGKQG